MPRSRTDRGTDDGTWRERPFHWPKYAWNDRSGRSQGRRQGTDASTFQLGRLLQISQTVTFGCYRLLRWTVLASDQSWNRGIRIFAYLCCFFLLKIMFAKRSWQRIENIVISCYSTSAWSSKSNSSVHQYQLMFHTKIVGISFLLTVISYETPASEQLFAKRNVWFVYQFLVAGVIIVLVRLEQCVHALARSL